MSVPRKRGRPRKFVAPPYLDGVEAREADRSISIPAKRGRGRPSKGVNSSIVASNAGEIQPEPHTSLPLAVLGAQNTNRPKRSRPQYVQYLCCYDKFLCRQCRGETSNIFLENLKLIMWQSGVCASFGAPTALYSWPLPLMTWMYFFSFWG
jgi:hypothetical protein